MKRNAVAPQVQHLLVINQPTPEQTKLQRFPSVTQMIQRLRPEEPVHCIRPQVMMRAAKWFVSSFPGEVMYSVKSNPDPVALRALHKAGVRKFDVASPAEIELVAREFPRAKMYYMHPVKSREAIYTAYFKYGIRDFSLDSFAELKKIMEVTGQAKDLNLYLRLAMPKAHAAYSLAGKFGISLEEAPELLVELRRVSKKVGICFHVGSQCMDPGDYTTALNHVSDLLAKTGVTLDMLDIGGGFPSVYPGMVPPALVSYMDTIRASVAAMNLPPHCEVLCEPGRALVAEGGSVVVRVELRKGNMLYVNDGIYGSLFDAGFPGFVFPAQAYRAEKKDKQLGDASGPMSETLEPFGLFGPTCDSIDAMKGPFLLPADIREGDWIEIGQLGAYGATLRTRFNGFYSDRKVEVGDQPIMSLFEPA